MNKEKRIFVLDTKAGEAILEGIFFQLEEKNIEAKLKLGIYSEEIPKDYDIYFLHLNDLKETNQLAELVNLKKSQPESYFLEIGVGGGYFKGNERIKQAPMIFSRNEINDILEKAYNK